MSPQLPFTTKPSQFQPLKDTMKKLLFTLLLGFSLVFGAKGAVLYPDQGGGGTNGGLIPLISYTTNYYLFTTNLYRGNTTVNTYFTTNVFNNVNMSNYLTTNAYIYITNISQTNLTVTNFYGGDTFVSNFFNTNIFTTSPTFVSNYFVTNLFSNTQIITTNFYGYTTNLITTNLFATYITNNTLYSTNIFLTSITTNFFVYSTNIFNSNAYVSNYYNTNVVNNSYVSNFFNTNIFSTNLNTFITVTNFIAGDTIVSNFFNTNIFVTDNFVSNYFVTNIFQTTAVTSNYTVNLSAPLTNATLYGITSFAPTNGTGGGVVWFKTNSWAGPTNSLPLNAEDQFYITFTDVNVTNISLLPNTGYSAGVLLTITNAASTNITLRLSTRIGIPERTSSVTISNASRGMLSLRYSPAAGTNAVYRQF